MATQQEDLRKRPLQSKGPEAEPDGGGNNVTANVSSIDIATGEPWQNVASGPSSWRLSLPLLLTLIAIYMFGHQRGVPDCPPHPYLPWYLLQWILQEMSIVSSVLMGLSAWLVWAEGGFHGKAIPLYLVQLGLSLSWNPIIFTVGMNWLGSAVMVGRLGSLFGCYRTSRKVNPIASDLVMLCLTWAGILFVVNVQVLAM